MFSKTTTVLFWLATICCVWAFHLGIQRRMARLGAVEWTERAIDRMLPAMLWIGLIIIAAYGLFLRLYKFPALPGGVNQDGAMGALDAMALAKYGTDRLGTAWPAHLEAWSKGQMSAMLTYMQAGLFKLFGESRLTMRLPLMLVTLASIPVYWDMARRTLGKRFGYLALALLMLNPWHIMQSRWAIDCALFPHFFLFGTYCLLRGYERKAWYYVAMVFYALSMYTYGVSLYAVPFFLIAAGIALVTGKRIRWYEALICAGIYLVVAAPFLATMILNYVGGESFKLFGLTIQYYPESVRSTEIVFMQDELYPGFVRNTKYLLDVLLYQTDGYMYMDLPQYGAHYLFSLPLILFGVVLWWCDRIQKRVLAGTPGMPDSDTAEGTAKIRWGMLLVLLWFVMGCWVCLNTDAVHLGKGAILMYPVMLMIAYAVYRVGQRQRVLAVVLVLATLYGGVRFGLDYFSADTQHKLGHYYYADLTDAMEAARGRKFDTLYVTQSLPEENIYGIPEELLIEYTQRLEPGYTHGDQEVLDPDGRMWLPFDERYQLMDITTFLIDPEEKARYIVYDLDINDFDPELFTIEQFGEYYLVTPKVLEQGA